MTRRSKNLQSAARASRWLAVAVQDRGNRAVAIGGHGKVAHTPTIKVSPAPCEPARPALPRAAPRSTHLRATCRYTFATIRGASPGPPPARDRSIRCLRPRPRPSTFFRRSDRRSW